jgi:hypothetical protein
VAIRLIVFFSVGFDQRTAFQHYRSFRCASRTCRIGSSTWYKRTIIFGSFHWKRTHTLYCDLPHLLQNFACAGIVAPHIMQLFVVFLGSSMSTGLNVGSCCCGWGDGSV